MISPRQKPAGSAHLLRCHFAQVLSAALQRAKLLRGMGSAVLAAAPPCAWAAGLWGCGAGAGARSVPREERVALGVCSSWAAAVAAGGVVARWAGALCPGLAQAGRTAPGEARWGCGGAGVPGWAPPGGQQGHASLDLH